MPNPIFNPAQEWFDDMLRMTLSTVDDAEAAIKIAGGDYSEFNKRVAFIMFGRILDAHVHMTHCILKKLAEIGIPVDRTTLNKLEYYGRLPEKIKMSFNEMARVRPDHVAPDFSGSGWAALQRALEVRNRLVHPESGAHLVITEKDAKDMIDGLAWFNAAFAHTPPNPGVS